MVPAADTQTSHGEPELDIGPGNKSSVGTDPWEDHFAPPPIPGLSAGLTGGQRAGRSSGRLRNVSLTGCKDKQTTRLRRGLLVVMSHRFTPGPFGSRMHHDCGVSVVAGTLRGVLKYVTVNIQFL